MRTTSVVAIGMAAAALASCGGDAPAAGAGGGTCTPGTTAGITITATGVSPKAVCVLPAGTVRFTNSDTVAHTVQSVGGCTQLDLGPIAPAGSATATFPIEALCSFRDAAAPTSVAFQGTVAVTVAPATGGGY